MPTYDVTIYRPRLERTTIRVAGYSIFEAENKALDMATDELDWELLPAGTRLHESGYNEDPFTTVASPRFPGK